MHGAGTSSQTLLSPIGRGPDAPGACARGRPRRTQRYAGEDANEAEDEVLRKIFFQMDSNTDGLIDQEEFLNAVKDIGNAFSKLSTDDLEEIFLVADSDRDGLINLEDFGTWITTTKENLAYFQMVDSDFDGCIDREEWKSVIEKMELDLSDDTISKTFDRADVDNSGTMSFLEFFKYMNGISPKEGFVKRARKWLAQKMR